MFSVERPEGGKPAGAGTGEVQFNDSGSFNAAEDFTYALTAGPVANLHLGASEVEAILHLDGTVINSIISGVGLSLYGVNSNVQNEAISFELSGLTPGHWYFGGNATIGGANLVSEVTSGTLALKEVLNGMQGVARLVAGTVTVGNVNVVANSRILVTSQADGGAPGFLRITNIAPGVSFTITSGSIADTSEVFYLILQVAP